MLTTGLILCRRNRRWSHRGCLGKSCTMLMVRLQHLATGAGVMGMLGAAWLAGSFAEHGSGMVHFAAWGMRTSCLSSFWVGSWAACAGTEPGLARQRGAWSMAASCVSSFGLGSWAGLGVDGLDGWLVLAASEH